MRLTTRHHILYSILLENNSGKKIIKILSYGEMALKEENWSMLMTLSIKCYY